MNEQNILDLGFKAKGKAFCNWYSLNNYSQARFGDRRFSWFRLAHDVKGNSIKWIAYEYEHQFEQDIDDEVLYEGECLSLEELINIITKTTTIKIKNNKIIE